MIKVYKIIWLSLFLGLIPFGIEAATLSFSPSSGSYAVGNSISVNVFISNSDQSMNAASGVVSFPSDKLEVVSVSKTGSIFTLWVQEPSFSNSAGTVTFEGIVLNPGFMGANGKAITINFKVKAAGVAVLNFSSGSVLANDGKGTNILSTLGSAQFNLSEVASNWPTVSKSTIPFVFSKTPSAPKISSPTHPDQTEWYSQKDAKFVWSLPDDALGTRLLVGKSPSAIPTVAYAPAIDEKEITDFKDGVWYFHAQLRNASGWGETAHFKLQIDTQPPEQFAIKFIDGNKTENPQPVVAFSATDSLSGIDYYKIKIGESEALLLSPDTVKNKHYTLPPQNPGKQSILVQAYDKAGNYQTAVGEFEILAINPPVITEYPKELKDGELLVVRGLTYANSQASIWLQKGEGEPKNFVTQSNKDGKFGFVAEEKLKEGVYRMWAMAVNAQGAQSLPTEKLTITVLQPTIFRVGTLAISLLIIAIPLAVLMLALILILFYGWRKFSMLRKKLKKEVREAESTLRKTFDLLKKDIREQIKMLEKTRAKRLLTEEEEKIIKQFGRDLDDAEEVIEKEIEDIEREIK